MSAPPELAAATTPPAMDGLNPEFLMRGIVKVPVVTVLATALPESEPIRPLATTAIFPGAPLLREKTRPAISRINPVTPVSSRSAPKTTKRKT